MGLGVGGAGVGVGLGVGVSVRRGAVAAGNAMPWLLRLVGVVFGAGVGVGSGVGVTASSAFPMGVGRAGEGVGEKRRMGAAAS